MIPKFRAWDKEQQCYRNGYELYLELESGGIWELTLTSDRFDITIDATVKDRFIIEQYIDRKDKNKFEIHVGDF